MSQGIEYFVVYPSSLKVINMIYFLFYCKMFIFYATFGFIFWQRNLGTTVYFFSLRSPMFIMNLTTPSLISIQHASHKVSWYSVWFGSGVPPCNHCKKWELATTTTGYIFRKQFKWFFFMLTLSDSWVMAKFYWMCGGTIELNHLSAVEYFSAKYNLIS